LWLGSSSPSDRPGICVLSLVFVLIYSPVPPWHLMSEAVKRSRQPGDSPPAKEGNYPPTCALCVLRMLQLRTAVLNVTGIGSGNMVSVLN